MARVAGVISSGSQQVGRVGPIFRPCWLLRPTYPRVSDVPLWPQAPFVARPFCWDVSHLESSPPFISSEGMLLAVQGVRPTGQSLPHPASDRSGAAAWGNYGLGWPLSGPSRTH